VKKILNFLLIACLLLSCKGSSSSSSGSTGTDSSLPDTLLASTTTVDTVVKDDGIKDAAALVYPKPTNVKILYGTDRKVISGANSPVIFSNQPANPGEAKYSVGYTLVSVPPNHKPGKIETPSIWKLEIHEDTLKHMVQRSIVQLSNMAFDELLNSTIHGNEAFIFVHGYNNSFKEAALRTAQLATDIHLQIMPIMFSWSSNGKTGDYAGDEDRVQLAVPAFKDFIKRVAKKGHFKKIHLIAHSMGNRLITSALLQLEHDTTNLKLDQIIMAAPDVYADLFKLSFADAVVAKCNHITIYSAKNDWALLASKKLHGNLRLGEIGVPPPAYIFKKIDIIDAVNEKTDFLGHDRFARSPMIIADMDKILKYGENADQRGIQTKMYGSYKYYFFQKDE
jgi:esterase/lipase superfamily enzyme